MATTNKVAYALAVGIAYPLLDALGFSAERHAQGIIVRLIISAVLPTVCFLASAVAIGRVQGTGEATIALIRPGTK